MTRASRAAVVVLCLLAGVGNVPRAAAQRAATAEPVSIPFERAGRHVIVKVTVNQSRPLSFVLDTGAHTAIIQTEVARELGLKLDAGIREGDIIASVDNAPAERLTISVINEMFEKPVSYTLTIRRGDQTFKATLTPRRLI